MLLRISLADGTSHSAILRPSSAFFRIPLHATKGEVAVSYWRMGVIHILEGVDHLLFLFSMALLLIVSGFGKLLQTVTAFTLAHSLTLALATLGFVHVPPAPTEAVISLSILFLAAEIVRKQQGEVGLTERKPWLVALAFGLFHGLGFAGALSAGGRARPRGAAGAAHVQRRRGDRDRCSSSSPSWLPGRPCGGCRSRLPPGRLATRALQHRSRRRVLDHPARRGLRDLREEN